MRVPTQTKRANEVRLENHPKLCRSLYGTACTDTENTRCVGKSLVSIGNIKSARLATK